MESYGMSTGSRIRTVFVGLAAWGCLGFAQEGGPALVAIRHAPQPSGARVTLELAGEIRYTTTRTEHGLVLGFPRTRLAAGKDTRSMQFQSGPVRSVTSGRVGRDSVVVTVVLRDRATSTLTRPSAGNALYVDVTGDPDAPVRAVKPAPVTPAAAPARAETRQQPGLVDIAAVARAQVEERRKSPSATPVKDSGTAGTPEGATPSDASLPFMNLAVFAAALLLSVCGTVAFLAVLHRRTAKTPPAARGHRVELPQVAPPVQEPPVTTAIVDQAVPEDAEPMFDDNTRMAKIFQRGKEEVNLAMSLRTRTAPRANSQRLAEVVRKHGSNMQRRTAARKLGVGVGEVELALHLKDMENRSKRKEGEK